ncbi:MAG: 50S ribosomal protein L16 [Candidatus Vogelbacteria bacterium]|nr:50S ribosomal protein L16 [Candidatus Vogelbacteria bacterium]
MLLPKKVKFRKWHTMRRNPGKPKSETRGISLAFGSHGLKAMTAGRVRSNQLEAARKSVMHEIKKTGKLWIRIFPDKPYTAKAAEVGMGKGKGDPQGYESLVWPGRIIFEIDGVVALTAKEALRKAGAKLPLKTKVISRTHE